MLLFTPPNYDIQNGCGIVQRCISSADVQNGEYLLRHNVGRKSVQFSHGYWLESSIKRTFESLIASKPPPLTMHARTQQNSCLSPKMGCLEQNYLRLETGSEPRWPHVFSNRSVKQREDILTNKLAANTHVIARKT